MAKWNWASSAGSDGRCRCRAAEMRFCRQTCRARRTGCGRLTGLSPLARLPVREWRGQAAGLLRRGGRCRGPRFGRSERRPDCRAQGTTVKAPVLPVSRQLETRNGPFRTHGRSRSAGRIWAIPSVRRFARGASSPGEPPLAGRTAFGARSKPRETGRSPLPKHVALCRWERCGQSLPDGRRSARRWARSSRAAPRQQVPTAGSRS